MENTVKDTGYHVSFLAAALWTNEQIIFDDYVRWVRVLFENLRIPVEWLVGSLADIRDVLPELVSPEVARDAAAVIDAALLRMNDPGDEMPTHIQPDAPLSELEWDLRVRDAQGAWRILHTRETVFAGLNDFKAINDECGHAVGDEALRLFAAALQRCARRADIVARFGGDEFVVLIDEGGDTGPSLLAERLHAELAAVESPCGRPLSASVGAAVGRVGGMDDLQALLEEADRAMYAEKNRRKSAGA